MRRRHRTVSHAIVAAALGWVVAAVLVAPASLASTIKVDCAHKSLATAIAKAPPGSTIEVSGTCTGNFVIDKNLTVVGAPSATLDGGGAGTTLTIIGFKAVHLAHLVITGGLGTDGGGVADLSGGSLSLDHVKVSGNSATGGSTPGSARGGGIFVQNPAFVTLSHSTITNNHVSVSGSNAEIAYGGGLYVTGQLTISDSTVTGNTAHGSSNNNAGDGDGAGIAVQGSMTMTGTKVSGNQASGQGPQFGDAHGGGIFWLPVENDVLDVFGSTISWTTRRARLPERPLLRVEGCSPSPAPSAQVRYPSWGRPSAGTRPRRRPLGPMHSPRGARSSQTGGLRTRC
jgi:hypothetical protein